MRLTLACLLLAAGLGCGRARDAREQSGRSGASGALAVAKGPFERRLLLSGEIDAVASAELKVPRIPMGRVTVRWLAGDGVPVKPGDKLAELDNANFVAQVRERTLSVSQSETELKRQQWQNELDESDRALEVERKRAALRRAEIDADLPEGILPKRDYLEKQMAVRKARADLERAEETLATQRRTAALDLQQKRISLEKVRRELLLAQQMIDALTLRAPADGTIIVGEHWEGRKLQVADELPVGHTIVRMPDLKQIRVKAALSDVDDGRVAAGMPAEIVLDAYPDRVLKGQVLEIAAVAREATERSLRRVFQVSVGIDGTEDATPRPGMSARVEVIAHRESAALLVPRETLELGEGTPAVRLADGSRRPVTLGPCNASACVVMSGVQAGEPLKRSAP
jgi:multidrug resistance efflux pump